MAISPTPASRAALRDGMASHFAALLAQGAWVEDILYALRAAVQARAAQARAERVPARRAELRHFYTSTDRVLADACQQLEAAGVAAKRATRPR